MRGRSESASGGTTISWWSVPFGDEPRRAALVEVPLLEAHGEGPYRLRAPFRGERDQRRGVEAAGEEHAHRHVGDQVRRDRVAKALAELLCQRRGVRRLE
jgi:hypothetical protein